MPRFWEIKQLICDYEEVRTEDGYPPPWPQNLQQQSDKMHRAEKVLGMH